MIRVLCVDDSAVVRELVTYILQSDPGITVVGTAANGAAALPAAKSLLPTVITMDIHMPEMDGFEATRRIMEEQPTPIVIVSGSMSVAETSATFRAIEAGALAVVARPPGMGHPGHEDAARQLIQMVKAMAEVKVVKRWPRNRIGGLPTPPPQMAAPATAPLEIVAIGASTGGPLAIQSLLSALPREFDLPILVVQHMAPGFIQGFAEWLAQTCERPTLIAGHGVRVAPGHVYIAPDGRHMGIDRHGRIVLQMGVAGNGLCPAVSCLFQSVAESYGTRAAAVLLTGMGKDGAAELKLLRDAGATTYAQSEESSVIFGMPGEAIRLEGAMYIMAPAAIAKSLAAMTMK